MIRGLGKIGLIGIYIFGLTLCCSISLAKSTEAKSTDFNIQSIKTLLNSEASPQSVEELLAHLPKEYRSYYTLFYRSKSLHKSDPKNPRILFYGPTGRFITGVSTLESDKRHDSMEFVQFEKGRFDFYRLTFAEGSKPQLETNPAQCRLCHRDDQRPNWEPYSIWPGAYGSFHDRIRPETEEHKNFASLLRSYQSDPRLKYLNGSPALNPDIGPKQIFYFTGNAMGRNSLFTILLSHLNFERIAQKLASAPKRFHPSIAAVLVGCDDFISSYLPFQHQLLEEDTEFQAYTKTRMKLDYDRRHEEAVRFANAEKVYSEDNDKHEMRSSEIHRISNLRYLADVLGFDFESWSMSVRRNSHTFNDGVNGTQNLITHFLAKSSFSLPVDILIDTVDFPLTKVDGGKYSIKVVNKIVAPKKACEELKQQSLEFLLGN